jgi:sugar/nucleoside kinase (ribokinase family)
VLTFSDPAMVKFFKPQLKEMLTHGVDLLFCNEEEAMSWSNTSNIADAGEALKQICKQFAITLGSKGALLFDGEKPINIQSEKVKAVDTNGAGDMFAGAFLYALGAGYDFQKAGDFACLSAANVVSQFGPRLAIPQHAELLTKAKSTIFKT